MHFYKFELIYNYFNIVFHILLIYYQYGTLAFSRFLVLFSKERLTPRLVSWNLQEHKFQVYMAHNDNYVKSTT